MPESHADQSTKNNPWVLGLTGGIGSGKSLAAQYFRELGITVIDADQVARQVVEPQQPALAKIAEHFGVAILQADGSLNRAALRKRIFDDATERRWLEQLLHPLIKLSIEHSIKVSCSRYVVLESPLLLETDQHLRCHRILLIDSPEDLQIARVTLRDRSSRDQIQKIMDAQLSRNERRKRADDILLNDKNVSELRSALLQLHQRYLIMAQQHDTTN